MGQTPSKPQDQAEHHLARLIELRDKFCKGSAAEFARKMEIADTYAVRMFWPLGTPGRKGLGVKMQGKVRATFNLCPGWFDLPLGSELSPLKSQTPPSKAEEDVAPWGHSKEESLLLRAFRFASADVRRMWLRQAESILDDLNTPSQLPGEKSPRTR